MKKSWVPVVACLAFIVLWQVFIVNPYNSKHRPLTKPITAPVTTPADSGEQAKGTLSTVPGATPVMTAMDDAQAVSIDIGPKRQVKVFPDFSLGSVVFWDYFVRGSKEKQAMVELKEGLHWTSTDPQVESCLLALRQGVVDPKNLVRESSVAAGKCKVTLAPDAAKAGLTHLSLQLSGFKGAQGFVELKGTDMVGAGPVQDHNYFGYRMDESRHWVKDKSLLEVTRKEGKVDWVTWGDKYFVTAFLPRGEYNPNVVYGPIPPTDGKDKHVYFGIQYPLFAKTEANANYEVSIYFGTRDTEQLLAVDPRLQDAVDLGFFGAVAKILIWSLKKLNIVFHNFGISIIALTILVRLAFWPLNRKVFMSGQKMKTLQPQIEKLKAKYAGDRSKAEQMNREMMELYRKNQVNPLGSCMPLLLQLPIFAGLYTALGHSLDLYQAPFVGWIQDLSSKDPLYIFPALWTISLVGYMRLNPQQMNTQPGQPDMKWIMMGMNVFFGYLSKDWPSGLTLYLFVSNFVGIIQQLMLRRDPKLQPIQEGV